MNRMAVPTDRQTWVNFVRAEYHEGAHLPGSPCVHCPPADSDKCKRYFCRTCKEGSLCKEEFKEGRPHFQHDLPHGPLQVFKTSRNYTVREGDLRLADWNGFLDTAIIMQFNSNTQVVHYLRTRKCSIAAPVYCHGCQQFIANAKTNPYKDRNALSAKVCSVKCFLRYMEPAVYCRKGHLRKQLKPSRSPLQ